MNRIFASIRFYFSAQIHPPSLKPLQSHPIMYGENHTSFDNRPYSPPHNEARGLNDDEVAIIRNYRKTVESLTLDRTKGHKTFCKALRKIEIPEETISSILMAPSLYANDQEWLEWLWMIQHDPYNIPLEQFLSLSGSSKIVGDSSPHTILDWKSARGQEEIIHKAIRVVYPKPEFADWGPWLLMGLFYVLGFPGSIFVYLYRRCKIQTYIPYSTMWTVSGLLLVLPTILLWKWMSTKVQVILVPWLGFNMGLILCAGFGNVMMLYYRYHLETSWVGRKGKNKSLKWHYAENRSIALLFRIVFGVYLPSFTSQWIYPIMYPLLSLVPSVIGHLLLVKVWGGGNVKQTLEYAVIPSTFQAKDLVTWIGVIGANILVFVNVIRVIAKFALFRDPVLDRLTCQNPR